MALRDDWETHAAALRSATEKDVNRIELCGRLGRDAESRTLSRGYLIVNFSVATEERWKDKRSGEWKSQTQWHNCCVKFNDSLVEAATHLRKGDRVRVVGKMTYRNWETQGGEKRTATEVEIGRHGELSVVSNAAEKPRAAQTPQTPGGGNLADLDSDIPFSPLLAVKENTMNDDPRAKIVFAWFSEMTGGMGMGRGDVSELLSRLDAAASAPPPANAVRVRAAVGYNLRAGAWYVGGRSTQTHADMESLLLACGYEVVIGFIEADVPLPATPTISARIVEEGR